MGLNAKKKLVFLKNVKMIVTVPQILYARTVNVLKNLVRPVRNVQLVRIAFLVLAKKILVQQTQKIANAK